MVHIQPPRTPPDPTLSSLGDGEREAIQLMREQQASPRDSSDESLPRYVLTPHARVQLRTENKIHCPEQADARPEIIALHRLVHVKHGKRHEYRQGDDFLEDFELRQIEDPVA